MTTPLASLNPTAPPERQEQTKAFLEEFWKFGEAVGVHGSSWYELSLAAWLAACDWQRAHDDLEIAELREYVDGDLEGVVDV